MKITPMQPTEEKAPLLGQEVKIFKDEFFPEAMGKIERVRGHGTLQAVEIRVHQNQPGPRVRVAFVGGWELIEGGGESQ